MVDLRWFDQEQGLVVLHGGGVLYQYLDDLAFDVRFDFVEKFHCLDDTDRVPHVHGIADLEDPTVLHQKPFNEIGRPLEIAGLFGGREAYHLAIRELEDSLYSAA